MVFLLGTSQSDLLVHLLLLLGLKLHPGLQDACQVDLLGNIIGTFVELRDLLDVDNLADLLILSLLPREHRFQEVADDPTFPLKFGNLLFQQLAELSLVLFAAMDEGNHIFEMVLQEELIVGVLNLTLRRFGQVQRELQDDFVQPLGTRAQRKGHSPELFQF